MTSPTDKIPENYIQPKAFTSKSLSSVEMCYSNVEIEVISIAHNLQKFYHCFAREVQILKVNKPLVVIFEKDVAKLSQR